MKRVHIILFFLLLHTSILAQIDTIKFLAYKDLLTYLENPNDSVFIEDRNKLEIVKNKDCNDSVAVLSDTLSSKNIFDIRLEIKPFQPQEHDIRMDTSWQRDDRYYIFSNDTVDGKRIYGTDRTIPRKEIKDLSLKINNRKIAIPYTAYSNLYEIHPCYTKAYETKDKKYLNVYFSGSDGAGSYCVKMIFNHEKYITRIVVELESYDFIDNIIEE